MKYSKPQALIGYYPDVTVDYSKIILSHGSLPQPVDPKVGLVEEGLKFSWDISIEPSWPESKDQVMMLVYFPDRNDTAYETSGAKRSKGLTFYHCMKSKKRW